MPTDARLAVRQLSAMVRRAPEIEIAMIAHKTRTAEPKKIDRFIANRHGVQGFPRQAPIFFAFSRLHFQPLGNKPFCMDQKFDDDSWPVYTKY